MPKTLRILTIDFSFVGILKGLNGPFFMAHLKKLPTWFVKGDSRRAAYYSIQARELRDAGYREEGEKAEVRTPVEKQPEIVVEAGTTAYDSTETIQESQSDGETLEEMTKAELLDWALDRDHDLKNSLPKSEIFAACKEIENTLQFSPISQED